MYRITDKIQYLCTLNEKSFDMGGDIEGFFEIRINSNTYGHYHANPLGNNEMGWYAISDWFNKLVSVHQKLPETNYIAINDTDTYNIWLEFKLDDGNILLSIVKAEKGNGTNEFTLEPLENFEYEKWSNVSLSPVDFEKELSLKISEYLNEIKKINPKILKNKRIDDLSKFISKNQEKEY